MAYARTNKIRLGCEIALSVITVVIAIVFITQVADIYYSAKPGEDIYSRAIVWGKLKYLIAPIAVWLCAVIACFVLSVIYPDNALPQKQASAAERVKRLRKRIPQKGSGDPEFENERKRYAFYEMWRYIAYGVASAFALAVSVYTIVYLSDIAHFSSPKINTDILALVRNVFPWIIASFVLFIGAVIYEWAIAKAELKSITKMLTLCKGMPISSSPLVARMTAVKKAIEGQSEKIVWIVRGVVLALALVFIGLGIWNGGMQDVLYKAINICTECIGLG